MVTRAWQWQLRQFTRTSLELEDRVQTLVADASRNSALRREIATALQDNIGQPVSIDFLGWESLPFGQLMERLGESVAMIGCEVPGLTLRCAVVADWAGVGYLVDRQLGGSGARGEEPTPLSEAEQGVLQYLALQCLARFHAAAGTLPLAPMRYERLLLRHHHVAEWLPPREIVTVFAWRLTCGETVHVVRWVVPQVGLLQALAGVAATPVDEAQRQRQLAAYAGERVEVWAEAGVCEVLSGDLAGLAPGDVVLLDRSLLAFADGQLHGDVVLRVGTGQHGGIVATIEPGKRLRCAVKMFE